MIRIVTITAQDEACAAIARTGADPYAVPLMAAKARITAVEISDVDTRAANLLKQEMLALGADAAVSHAVARFEKGSSTVLLLGTPRQLQRLIPRLARQPFGLKLIAQQLACVLAHEENNRWTVRAGTKALRLGTVPVLMGILNVTPDSFSDGGA